MIPRIETDPEQGVLIEWLDGHQSRYSFQDLREACPCAVCRDGGKETGGAKADASRQAKPARPGDLTRPAEATRLLRIVPIGRYAIGLVWGDGHSTGIYSWDYLRERCGCLACRFGRREVEG
jgi:DUF971 family protein